MLGQVFQNKNILWYCVHTSIWFVIFNQQYFNLLMNQSTKIGAAFERFLLQMVVEGRGQLLHSQKIVHLQGQSRLRKPNHFGVKCCAEGNKSLQFLKLF